MSGPVATPAKPVRITKAIERQRWRLLQRLEKAAKRDGELLQLVRQANELWNRAYTELNDRAWAAAEAEDAGEMCWTLFVPGKYMVHAYARSPRRAWKEHFFSWGHQIVGKELAQTDPWLHLARVKEMAAIQCPQVKAELEAA